MRSRKKGVVREKSTHLEVIQMVMAYAAEIGFEIRNLEFSPIKGPEGNIEYLLYLHKPEQASEETVTGEEALAKAEKSVRFHRNRLLRKLTGS